VSPDTGIHAGIILWEYYMPDFKGSNNRFQLIFDLWMKRQHWSAKNQSVANLTFRQTLDS
jgi:hypothetical protein